MFARLRAPLAVAVAVVLLVLGGTTAYAAWSVSRALPTTNVQAGTFSANVVWTSAPSLADMYPGESRAGTMTISRPVGTNGKWVYRVGAPTFAVATGGPPAASAAVVASLSGAVYNGAASGSTCSGTAVTPGATSAVMALNATVTLCVKVTLASTATTAVRGGISTLTLLVTAENRPTN